jgi:hypothetical protein
MKRSEETFVRVLDAILTYGSLTKASQAAEIDPWTLARWRKSSEDGDEEFQECDYHGAIQPFHLQVEDTIEQSIDEIESNFRGSARDGIWRPILWHGSYQYEDDEHAMSLSEKDFQDELDLGLVWPDKKRRVRNPTTGEWERVKILEWIPPSTEAQTIVLRSWSDRYADKRSLNINGRLDVNQTLGVTVIGQQRVAPPPQQLQVISPEVANAVNDEVTDAVFNEPKLEDEPMTDLTPEPLPEPDPNSPLTPEQQAILARARSGNRLAADLAARALARKPATAPARPAPPPAPVYRGDLDQDDSTPRNPIGKKVV